MQVFTKAKQKLRI